MNFALKPEQRKRFINYWTKCNQHKRSRTFLLCHSIRRSNYEKRQRFPERFCTTKNVPSSVCWMR